MINTFKRDLANYNMTMNPVAAYMEQSAIFLSKNNGKSIEENRKRVRELLSKEDIKNPIVKYHYKEDNGDKEVRSDKLTDYMKDVMVNNELIVPSFTTYIHPSTKKSLHAEFLEENINKRKEDKHNAFKFKQQGDDEKYLYFNTLQKTRKIFNNSLSGAYASKSTVLYNSSAHYSLTSTTRSVTSIGNAITESMVAGNKHFKDPSIVMNYITAIITIVDLNKIRTVIDKYAIHVPTPVEVFNSITRSTNIYWNDKVKEDIIYNYISKLNSIELCAVLYVNDLFHFREYNDLLTRDIISKLSTRVTEGSLDNLYDLKNTQEGVMNLVHHICADDIRGINVDYEKMTGTDKLMTLASTAKSVSDHLVTYTDLIQAFFVTDVMPPTIAYIKDMLRSCIVLSDTDSTCGSYDNWVDWYFGGIVFTPEATAVAATVMTINTQVIDHYLKVFSSNMNIDKKDTELIKMKNEFYWDVFTSTNVSKHYYARIRIQEGNVFEEPDLELKGVHLIASAVNKDIRDIAYKMINDVNEDITSGRGIDLHKYIKIAADTERGIINEIKRGGTNIFRVDKIKEEGSYKLDRSKSPYFHHLLWEEVFADKYTTPGNPTYMVINVPTIINSKRSLSEFLNAVTDSDIRIKLTAFLNKFGKDSLGSFRVPLIIASEKGLPEEIYHAIDFYKVVSVQMNAIWLVLESLSFFRKPNLLISEMGY